MKNKVVVGNLQNVKYSTTAPSGGGASNSKDLSVISAKLYANVDYQKLEILTENKGKSGIYLWKHKTNGKFYVGSSQDIARRLRQYYNINHLTKYSGMYINRALLKDGYSFFSLYILEYCDKKDLIQREQYYFDLLNPEYNILEIAGSSLGYKHTKEAIAKISSALKGQLKGELNPMFGKKHTEESIAKMSGIKRSEETRAKMSTSKTGYKHTEVTRAKMSSVKKGQTNPMFGKLHSEDTWAKLVATQKDKCQTIEVTDLTNQNQTKIYESIRAAGRALNISHTHISNYFRQNQKSPYLNRYIFKKV